MFSPPFPPQQQDEVEKHCSLQDKIHKKSSHFPGKMLEHAVILTLRQVLYFITHLADDDRLDDQPEAVRKILQNWLPYEMVYTKDHRFDSGEFSPRWPVLKRIPPKWSASHASFCTRSMRYSFTALHIRCATHSPHSMRHTYKRKYIPVQRGRAQTFSLKRG